MERRICQHLQRIGHRRTGKKNGELRNAFHRTNLCRFIERDCLGKTPLHGRAEDLVLAGIAQICIYQECATAQLREANSELRAQLRPAFTGSRTQHREESVAFVYAGVQQQLRAKRSNCVAAGASRIENVKQLRSGRNDSASLGRMGLVYFRATERDRNDAG